MAWSGPIWVRRALIRVTHEEAGGVCDARVRLTEVDTVEEIEELRPELEAGALGDFGVLHDSKIRVMSRNHRYEKKSETQGHAIKRMRATKIKYARATAVKVPARPDSVNSEEITDDNAEFAKAFLAGKSWPNFTEEIKWIVELESEDGTIGIGETYRGATRESVEATLKELVGLNVLQMNWRRLPVSDLRVYDAVESAVMDLAGKFFEVPVHQLLGGAVRDRVECSGWAGRRTPKDAARKAAEALGRGHRVFKFKCSDADSVREWSEKIQERCGTSIRILLDPNHRWKTVETTVRMMEGVNRECMFGLEDPVSRSDFAGYRQLRERLGIPIFLHVALPYGERPEDILTALSERCVDGFNFNGPMFAFVTLAEVAGLAGLTCWHGSEVDLGILEASALQAAAAAPACMIPSDILGELVRTDDLIEPPIKFERGYALVPQGRGLGVQLDRQALERFRVGDSLTYSPIETAF